jgi:Flp pilus assembly protein TadG
VTLIAAAAIPLVAFTGLAVDTARGYLIKTRLSYALDSAALAGGRVMFDVTARDAAIQKFFDANFPAGYMGATLTDPTTTVNTVDQTIKLDASVTLDTTLMSVLGVDDVEVAASAEVQRQVKGMELALVLDNTGSMRYTASGSSQSKVEDLKDASLQLVNILYAGREEIDDFYMSIVPYTSMVNVGQQHSGFLTGLNQAAYSPAVWKGCVEARHLNTRDRNDDTPSDEGFVPAYWPQTATSLDWPPIVDTNE